MAQQTVDWMAVRPRAAGSYAAGLRERKKAQLRQRLSDTATQMFLTRGYDAVRVIEIAAACDVSEKTVYNYFPTKESLVLDRWETTQQALRAGLSDLSLHPIDAARNILAGELLALTSWLDSQSDTAAAIESVRRFGELIAATPALRAYNHESLGAVTMIAAGLLAARAGQAADDPEPQIAATALLGLWGVHFTALRKNLHAARTPGAIRDAVMSDVDTAARLIRTGLDSYACGAPAAAGK
ncbi:MAG TPA: TetR/AcrR family transcriptional regulator [Streptosporangiaceae bacterium]|nr:TetR/AcrR family transcriptional regulator [Streptosporangiaceae bacterium]